MRDDHLPEITDEQMTDRLAKTREYTLMILRSTPTTFSAESGAIIWEHGRRNMALRADGMLAIVCPVTDGGEVAGIGIFDASLADVRQIMDRDPAIQAGALRYEMHPVRGFPSDRLP